MNQFSKFLIVGGIGFLINTVALFLGVRLGFFPSISGLVGAEIAIISNFILNNFFTFSDRAIVSWDAIPLKFVTFNILSFGSAIIQFLTLKIGEKIFGLVIFKKPFLDVFPYQKIPLISTLVIALLKINLLKAFSKKISLYFIFYCMGVGIGLVVNYFMYSHIIWK